MPAEAALAILDANVLIRYLTGDHSEHSRQALAFLQRVEAGTIGVTTCEGVLVEVVQVLSSKRLYNQPRERIAAALADILRLRGVHLPGKALYLRALELYGRENVDFVDALCVAHAERSGAAEIVSFDRDLDRFPGVRRIEP